MALIGAFLPWWGFDVSGIISTQAHRWTIWNPPRLNTQVPGAAAVSWNFTISSVSVLVLVLVATALVVVGSITLLRRYLLGGLLLSALAPVVYAVAINYVTMNYCITPFCVSGPVGSESVSRASGLSVAWGFQIGFYVFLAAVLVLIAGLLFNSRLGRGQVRSQMGRRGFRSSQDLRQSRARNVGQTCNLSRSSVLTVAKREPHFPSRHSFRPPSWP